MMRLKEMSNLSSEAAFSVINGDVEQLERVSLEEVGFNPISRWEHPRPCPRCGSRMDHLGIEVLWD